MNRAEILRALAKLHKVSGDLSEALECEHSAAAAAHRLGEEDEVAEGLYRIGQLYLEKGLRWEAREAFRESMEIFLRLRKMKKANRADMALQNAQTIGFMRARKRLYSQKLLLLGQSRHRIRDA